MSSRQRLLRDFEAGRHLDLLLVSAVTSVLLIRFYLAVTGYPQIGGSSLHIAHMLWGGLLMLVALVLLVSFVGRAPRPWGAVLGGVGFGTFIDEIGKFVTHDNDYFYEPSVSLIYAVLVLLYLAGRSLHRERLATGADHVANAVMEVLEIVRGDLDRREQRRALDQLERARDEPLAGRLTAILRDADVVPQRPPGVVERGARRLVALYRRLATTRWFGGGLIALFLLGFLLDLGRLLGLAHLLPVGGEMPLKVPLINPLPLDPGAFSPVQRLQFASSLLAGVFTAAGVVLMFRNRPRALRMFQRSVLVSLFLSQVFVFYDVQWVGLLGLSCNLLMFFALRFMLEEERRMREEERVRTAAVD